MATFAERDEPRSSQLMITSLAPASYPSRSASVDKATGRVAPLGEVGGQQLAGPFHGFGSSERHVEDQAIDTRRDELLDLLHDLVRGTECELFTVRVAGHADDELAGPRR